MIPLGSIWAAVKGVTALWGPIMDAIASLSDLTLQQAVTLGVLAIAIWSLGWGGNALVSPGGTVRTDTTYVNRQITRTDTVVTTHVRERRIYETVTDTVVRTITVPRSVNERQMSIVDARPLQIEETTATLTRYDVEGGRYVQDVYALPFDRHKIGISAAAVATPSAQLVMTTLSYRRRWDTPIGVLSAGPGAGVAWTPQHGREPAISLTASIRF